MKTHIAVLAHQLWKHHWGFTIGIAGILFITIFSIAFPWPSAHADQQGSWPTYLGNYGHSGYNGSESIINPTTAPNLQLHWLRSIGRKISTQPVEANGMIYWGSWDGIEHASTLSNGSDVWATNLGKTTDCKRVSLGVLSTAAVDTVTIGGVPTTAVFVAGGNNTLYALDANSGSILWQTPIGFAPNSFIYSSPILYNGNVYIGVSGNADCSHVQGQIVTVNASNGQVQATFNIVPAGCVGASVWSSPTLDQSTGMLYVTTSESAHCSQKETMATALLELNAANLSLVSSWHVPPTQRINDGDFGSSPTLFPATIGGTRHQMVGMENKNGYFYAFDKTNISAGPLWEVQLATTPGPSSASAAWDGTHLYVAAGTSLDGSCAGTLSSLDPSSGSVIWQDCLNYDALGGVTAVPGLIELGVGNTLMIFDATNGNTLFSYTDTKKSSDFLGPGSISNGVLYHGNMDGFLYAFGTQP